MSSQKFYANPATKCIYPNGAIGYGPGGPMDCLGNYAKVTNCPVIVDGAEVARLTCYATGYADTWFSIPACTRRKGKHVRGYFTFEDRQVEQGWDRVLQFRVMDSHKHLFR